MLISFFQKTQKKFKISHKLRRIFGVRAYFSKTYQKNVKPPKNVRILAKKHKNDL